MSYEEDIAFGVQQMLDADLQFPQEVHVRNVVKTIADQIRSMTDEELAETIVREFCAVSDNTIEFIVAKTRFRLWLKQPYEEDK